ncbi:MAG TPA: sigma 54-interacting transcriptional regulator [Candidatus Methylomirabilis sp.]|nr:sigma 54-interacting transcriptional regulator [Candidatus Methylomirabilis sp.]
MPELLGKSPAMEAVREKLRRLLKRARVGQRLPPVLLQGETGTGKGLVARLLHRYGPRAQGLFVDVNCAAIPETLLEAELFGFERGAFTDARRAKPGLFQAAHGGVLFLDEISLLAASAQAKLLTVIEDRKVRRLGSTRAESADVWLISATSAHLEEAARARRFRADLYHRLAIMTVELPPLRARDGDVLTLARGFLDRTCAEYHLPAVRLDASAERRLLAHSWPGNVRELGNVIERATLLADGPMLTDAALELSTQPGHEAADRPSLANRDAVKRDRLMSALRQTGWNISQTAAQLGVTRNTVYAYLDKFGLRPEHPDRSGSGRPASAPTDAGSMTAPPPPAALQWEPRNLALLRVELSETDGADRWSLASRTLELSVAKVGTFGGRVEDMTPTGLVAAFGLEPTEDAARRAAHAALAIHRAVQRPPARDGARRPAVVIGLHVAPFLIGHLAARTEIDAQGKRAQWAILDELLERTAPGQTTATAAAASFLERRFELAPAETGPRGTVYRLTGQERRGLDLWGVMTPFVGRRAEFDLLRHRSNLAASGHGQVIAILGDAGVGKSRLIHEFARAQRQDGWRVLETTAVSHGQAMSYLPVIALLKGYFAIRDGDDVPAVREKVAATLRALDPTLDPALPALLALLDVSPDEVPWRTLDPPQRRQRILDAAQRLLLREAREHPLLLIVEDLHWVDGETQALLDSLVDRLVAARLLLLVSYRPEYQHAWASKPSYGQARLDVLPGEQAVEFLSALVGDDAGLAPLKQLLVKRGNPFFLEETVRTLVEARALEGRLGDYRLARPLASLEIPPTVQAILAARIDRLASGDRQLLQTAAVIGKDVPLALLEAITGTDEATLRSGLARLQAAEFVCDAPLSREPELTFKHALTQEVAYSSLLQDRRCAMHARIVEAIERLHRDRLGEQTERLAHHALHGGLREKAVPYLRQAGLKAAARSALPEARTWFEQTLDVLAALPQNQSTMEQGFEIRLDLRPVLSQLGEIRRVLERLREAENLAEQLDDDRRRGRVCALLTNVHSLLGEFDEALASGTQALQIARRLADLKLRILTTTYLEQEYYYRGEYELVVKLCTENLAALPADAVFETFGATLPVSIYDRYWLVRSLAELGRFAEAAPYEAEARRLAELAHHAYAVGMSNEAGTWLYLLKGDWATARSLNERGLAAARMANVVLSLPVAVACSAWVLAQGGEASEALAGVREGEQLIDRDALRGSILRGRVYYALGRACLLLGRFDEARSLSERVLQGESSYSRPRPGFVANALLLLGDIGTHPDQFDAERAESHYRDALALAEPRGMRPLVAHCHFGLGKLCRRTGKWAQGREHLTAATTMYREMDMQYWLRQAEAEPSESA